MLRVILDTKNEASEKNIGNVNIQRTSFANIFSDEKSVNRFKNYLNKCLEDQDKILVISFMDGLYDYSTFEINNENIKFLKLILTEKSTNFVVAQVIENQNESLDKIEEKIAEIEEVFSLFFLSLMGY